MTTASLLNNFPSSSIPKFSCASSLMEKEGGKLSHIAFLTAIFLKKSPDTSLPVAYAQAASFLFKDKNYSAYYAWANTYRDDILKFVSSLSETLVATSLAALDPHLPEGVGTRELSKSLSLNKIPSYSPRKNKVSNSSVRRDVSQLTNVASPITAETPSKVVAPLVGTEVVSKRTASGSSLEEAFFKHEAEKHADRFRPYLRQALDLVIEEETSYFEARLMASLAKASDSIIDTFVERSVSGSLKSSLPQVVIIGPKEDQQHILSSEFGDIFKLRFVSSQESATIIPGAIKSAVHVIFWTAYCSHAMFDKVKDHPGLIQVPKTTGMSFIKKILSELALKKVA